MKWKDQPKTFHFYLYLMLTIVFILGTGLIFLVLQQLSYQNAVEARERSVKLAAELRQSSNDLARLARTYIITGNSLYKEQFYAAVEIRDGLRPRPENYNLAYWDTNRTAKDFHNLDKRSRDEAVSIIELIKKAGVTEAELNKLKDSKKKSDLLVLVEEKAIKLVDGTPTDRNKREMALSMLADENFISTKAQIMQSIVESEKMIFERTERAVDTARKRLILVIGSLYFFGCVLILLIFKVGKQLRRIIGCPIQELEVHLQALARGNFLTPIAIKNTDSDSIISWIAKSQKELAKLNLEHFKAIVDFSDDAIISKDTKGIIASWNKGAERIFGYSEEEIIGRSMITIIPNDRLHEEEEILSKISRGERVDHFVTQRKHKDGHNIDLSVSISPISNSDGEVIGASKIARDISEILAAQAEIKRLAFYDVLTGLANRRLMEEKLSQLLLDAKRDKFPVAVLFIDLDDFKIINDTRGHDTGDLLLKSVAKRLQDSVRGNDIVCRYGGDEFLILLSGRNNLFSSDAWVKQITDKIRTCLMLPYEIGLPAFHCTLSIGVFIHKGEQLSSAEIIQKADQAMYIAKRNKNHIHFYGDLIGV